ncbi:MAG TPA: AzlD domain-containing protein [Gammaproteobacteria bacterium]|nr:AzlD domain-containing protein [Gammaproteobacteria bacterium]
MTEVIMLICAIAGTYVWRALGVAFSARIEPDGALFRWVTCVSYAMLAALISRMTVIPLGSLAETPVAFRLGAMVVSIVVFFLTGRSMLLGVGAGVATFIALVGWA